MYLNPSKQATANLCWRKCFNQYHRGFRLEQNLGLSQGSAFHKGAAVLLSTKDIQKAQDACQEEFTHCLTKMTLLPEQEYILKETKDVNSDLLNKFQEMFGDEDWVVVQPECKFDVEIPDSHHNCIMTHWFEKESGSSTEKPLVEHWNFWPEEGEGIRRDKMSHQAITEGHIISPHFHPDPTCPCWRPHRIRGITDALVILNRTFWFLEYKMVARTGEAWWRGFRHDIQTTTYCYGVWKSLNIRPNGFVVIAGVKPSERQVKAWAKGRRNVSILDYIKLEREPFTREEEDLLSYEHDVKLFMDEYEGRIKSGYWPQANHRDICTLYGGCDFSELCQSNDNPGTLQDMLDEVEEKRRKLNDQ